MFRTVPAHVSVLTGTGPEAGQVVAAVTERHLAGRSPNATVVTDVDAAAFSRLFVEAIGNL